MTSNVTRLYRLDPDRQGDANGAGHRVKLRYMTPEQYRHRRNGLCSLLGFLHQDSDEGILAQIDEILQRDRDDQNTASRPFNENIEDCRYLARLLRSYGAFSSNVTDPPKAEAGEYSKRTEYINHPAEEISPYLLLSEVEIALSTNAISPKIELIDLPGLSSRQSSDDLLTQSFLPLLDGALIFQSLNRWRRRKPTTC